MILIYAYINKFKNYTTQEIILIPAGRSISQTKSCRSNTVVNHQRLRSSVETGNLTTCIFLLEKQGLERRICFR